MKHLARANFVSTLPPAPAEELNAPKAVVDQFEMEDDDADSPLNDVSGAMHPKEGSLQELIDKYQHQLHNPFLKPKAKNASDADDDEDTEPN